MALTSIGLTFSHKMWVKMLTSRVHPNTTTTLNVREMVTLTQMQRVGHIPWAQIIFNHLCTLTRTKLFIASMPYTIWRILEYVGVDLRGFYLKYGPEQYNWQLPLVNEGATKEDLRGVKQVPKPKMP